MGNVVKSRTEKEPREDQAVGHEGTNHKVRVVCGLSIVVDLVVTFTVMEDQLPGACRHSCGLALSRECFHGLVPNRWNNEEIPHIRQLTHPPTHPLTHSLAHIFMIHTYGIQPSHCVWTTIAAIHSGGIRQAHGHTNECRP